MYQKPFVGTPTDYSKKTKLAFSSQNITGRKPACKSGTGGR